MKLSRHELFVSTLIVFLVAVFYGWAKVFPPSSPNFSAENVVFEQKLKDKFQKARIADSLEMLKYTAPEIILAEEKAVKKTKPTASKKKELERPISINTANDEELQLLPRVGPATAKRIIEYRTQNGPFKQVQDIMKVKGIGPKTYEQMATMITL